MTQPTAQDFNEAFIDRQLWDELKQVAQARRGVIEAAEAVCAKLEQEGNPCAAQLRAAIERYKNPFSKKEIKK